METNKFLSAIEYLEQEGWTEEWLTWCESNELPSDEPSASRFATLKLSAIDKHSADYDKYLFLSDLQTK